MASLRALVDGVVRNPGSTTTPATLWVFVVVVVGLSEGRSITKTEWDSCYASPGVGVTLSSTIVRHRPVAKSPWEFSWSWTCRVERGYVSRETLKGLGCSQFVSLDLARER